MSLGLGSGGGVSASALAGLGVQTDPIGAAAILSSATSVAAWQGPTAILVISDSTGVEPSVTENWPYRMAQAFAQRYTAMSVVYSAWDAAAQNYGPLVYFNAGNEQRHILMLAGDGTARTRSLNQSLFGAITDLDLRVDVAATDWTPGTTASLVGQWGGAGTYGHRLQLLTTGGLRYMWSNDGTAQSTSNSTANLSLTDGQRYQIRVTHDVDNGSSGNTVTFYYKLPTDSAWTQLGSPVVTAGVTTINRVASRDFELGGTGSTTVVPGKYYAVEYRNGIDGPIVNPQPIECWIGNEDKTVTAGAPTVYIFSGAQSGAGIAPSNTTTSGFLYAARLAKMVPPVVCPMSVILNTGHNETVDGAAFATQLDTWLTSMKALLPYASFYTTTQNPRTDTIATRHRKRIGDLMGWARRNGVGIMDTYAAYLTDTRGVAALLQGDGLHPNADGAAVENGPVVAMF